MRGIHQKGMRGKSNVITKLRQKYNSLFIKLLCPRSVTVCTSYLYGQLASCALSIEKYVMHVIYTSKGMSKSLGCLLYIRCVLSIEKYSNLTFFFVPRTSIYELSSTFFAQFRYVYRIFLSGRVSKIQGNLSVQNSTLCAHETGRNFPLKCRSV